MNHILNIAMNTNGHYTPYIVIFVILLLCGLGAPIPEDITIIAGGMLSYYKITNIYIMILVCFLGVMTGDTTIFLFGNYFGPKIRRKRFFQRLLPPHRLEVVQKKLHREGPKVIFAARFMPGLRMPVYFTAGSLHLPFWKFFLYDGLAAMLSVPAIAYVIYHFGQELDRAVKWIKKVQFGIIVLIVIAVIVIIVKIINAYKSVKEEVLEDAPSSKDNDPPSAPPSTL